MQKIVDLPPMPETPVTDAELTVLLRYREQTTPGWTLEAPPKGPDRPRSILATSLCEWEEGDGWCGPSYGQVALFGYEGNIEADLMFCFLAHQQVPDMVKELRALRAEVAYLTEYCGELMLDCAKFNGFITTRGPDGTA